MVRGLTFPTWQGWRGTFLVILWAASTQTALSQSWNTNANGSWNAPPNWSPSSVPNAIGASVTLGNVITANRSINVNGNFSLGSLTINSTNNYTLNNNSLAFRVPSGSASLNVQNTGSPVINSALALSNNLTVSHTGTGTLTLAGAVSGAGSFTKTGTGLAVMSGSSANSFSGGTVVQGGELRLSKTSGNAIPGNLSIGDGTGTDIVRLAAGNQIADSATVTVNSSGQLLVSGTATDTIGAIQMSGGLVNTGTGTLTLTAEPAIVALLNSNTSTMAGRIVLQGAKTIQVADGASVVDLDITANIIDQFYTTVTKTGGGTVRLSGSNTFQGPLNIGQGVVIAASSGALGTSTFGNTVSNGAALHLTGGITVNEGSINLNGTGPDGAGALVSLAGSNNYTGTLTAASAATVGSVSGSTLALSGALDLASDLTFAGTGNFIASGQSYGAGVLVKTGTGTLQFSGAANDINGTRLDVRQGVVELNRPGRVLNTTQSPNVGTNSGSAAVLRLLAANQIRDDLFVNVNETGTFDLNGFNDGIAGLRLSGGSVQTGSGQLSIVNAGGDQIISLASAQTATIAGNLRSDLAQGLVINTQDGAAATDLDISAAFSGGVATVTKRGAGLATYSGTQANTYTGQTIVEAGTLVLQKTAGVDAVAGASLRVDGGATVRLGAANQIRDTTNLILAGGTFRTGATTGNSDTVGTLTLSSSSTISLGTGVHQLTFANSSAISWGGTLIITNWTGAAGGSGTQGRIFFGVGGLTTTQLAQVQFVGFGPGSRLLASGELVPIPEPRAMAAMAALAGFLAWRERGRLRAAWIALPWRRRTIRSSTTARRA